jgi:hypothetical protein
MLARARAALDQGRAILIFPEGVSQPEPVLMPLRTGAARILLGVGPHVGCSPAAGARVGDASDRRMATLIPIGLVYDDPATFRGGQASMLIGPPVGTADIVEGAAANHEAAVRELTDRIARALRAVIVEARDRETLDLVRLAERFAVQEGTLARRDTAVRADWRRRALRALGGDRDADPAGDAALEAMADTPNALKRPAGAAETLRQDLARLASDLGRSGLTGSTLAAAYPAGAVLRYASREGGWLLLGLPAALLGMLTHAVPYRLTAIVVNLLRPDPDVAATYKLGVGLGLYPLCWAAEAWLAWRIGGAWLVAAFGLGLLPGGLIALTWQDRLAGFRRRAQGFVHFLIDRDRHGHLIARRRELVGRLETLMQETTASRPSS